MIATVSGAPPPRANHIGVTLHGGSRAGSRVGTLKSPPVVLGRGVRRCSPLSPARRGFLLPRAPSVVYTGCQRRTPVRSTEAP